MERNAIEFTARDKSFSVDLSIPDAASKIKEKIEEMLAEINNID